VNSGIQTLICRLISNLSPRPCGPGAHPWGGSAVQIFSGPIAQIILISFLLISLMIKNKNKKYQNCNWKVYPRWGDCANWHFIHFLL